MPAKILVADDDVMLQRLISNTLKLEHHEIIVAANGPQALEMARTENPDLMILDVMMPGLNGFDVCAALRKDPATMTLPVIMLSGLGQVQEKIMGLKAGADEYLTKPIDPRELLTCVEMLLARHQVLRQSAAAKAGRVYSVIGAKGGVGVTTLAVNLAAYMAQQDETRAG
jgi:DNA-binding response OmpR family regulator